MKYNEVYKPKITLYNDTSSFYIEIPRVCYNIKELSKVDILVYSAILCSNNSERIQNTLYNISNISNRLNMQKSNVIRSIRKLEELGLIQIVEKNKKKFIIILKDLRYDDKTNNKSVILVYNRIFYYPLITKNMIHIYSYYLSNSNMSQFKNGNDTSFSYVSKVLNFSEKRLRENIKKMIDLGLFILERDKETKAKIIKVAVNFKYIQPEEKDYIQYLKDRAVMEEIEEDDEDEDLEYTQESSVNENNYYYEIDDEEIEF